MLYDGDIFELDGRRFRVRFPYDEDSTAPWDDCDGHGTVRQVRFGYYDRTPKRAGELVLYAERGAAILYDYEEACRIARKDGWGSKNCKPEMSKRQKAATAARDDYNFLRGWCNDLWCYVGVVVSLLDDEGDEMDQRSLWRIESDDYAYHEIVARELAQQLADSVKEPEYYI